MQSLERVAVVVERSEHAVVHEEACGGGVGGVAREVVELPEALADAAELCVEDALHLSVGEVAVAVVDPRAEASCYVEGLPVVEIAVAVDESGEDLMYSIIRCPHLLSVFESVEESLGEGAEVSRLAQSSLHGCESGDQCVGLELEDVVAGGGVFEAEGGEEVAREVSSQLAGGVLPSLEVTRLGFHAGV